jgi:hypothetical protein
MLDRRRIQRLLAAGPAGIAPQAFDAAFEVAVAVMPQIRTNASPRESLC